MASFHKNFPTDPASDVTINDNLAMVVAIGGVPIPSPFPVLGFVPYTGAVGTVDLNNQKLVDINQLGLGVVSPNSIFNVVIPPCDMRFYSGFLTTDPYLVIANTDAGGGAIALQTSISSAIAGLVFDDASAYFSLWSAPKSEFLNGTLGHHGHGWFRVKANGFVGIGTDYDPTQLFDVNGVFKVQSGGEVDLTGQLVSTLAIGTKPLAVTSTTLCDNLNADMLDGHHSGDFDVSGAAVAVALQIAGRIESRA